MNKTRVSYIERAAKIFAGTKGEVAKTDVYPFGFKAKHPDHSHGVIFVGKTASGKISRAVILSDHLRLGDVDNKGWVSIGPTNTQYTVLHAEKTKKCS